MGTWACHWHLWFCLTPPCSSLPNQSTSPPCSRSFCPPAPDLRTERAQEDAEEKRGHMSGLSLIPPCPWGPRLRHFPEQWGAPDTRPAEGEGCGAGTGGGTPQALPNLLVTLNTHTHTHTQHTVQQSSDFQNKENPLKDNLLPMFQSSRQFSDSSFL